jgi:hypothetical protein
MLVHDKDTLKYQPMIGTGSKSGKIKDTRMTWIV